MKQIIMLLCSQYSSISKSIYLIKSSASLVHLCCKCTTYKNRRIKI